MKMSGSSQNCQLHRTRLNTVKSQFSLRLTPSLLTACSLCSSVRYHAALWIGRSGIKTHPMARINTTSPTKKIDRGNIHTEQCHWKSHDRYDNKYPFPRRKTALSRQCLQESRLDPALGHAAKLAKDAEHCSASSQLGTFVPRSQNKLSADTVAIN